LETFLGIEFTGPCSKITRRKQTGWDVCLGDTVLSLEVQTHESSPLFTSSFIISLEESRLYGMLLLTKVT
jgi:hypothetical protein